MICTTKVISYLVNYRRMSLHMLLPDRMGMA